MKPNFFSTTTLSLFVTLLVGLIGLSHTARAKTPIPAKATVSCTHCTQLKAKANMVEKTLEANPDNVDKEFEAISNIQKALAKFLTVATAINEKEMDALLRAWSVVSIQDNHVSIPTHPDIKGKLSNDQFDKIQNAASEMAARYCQKSNETPKPPCSLYDQKIKRSYMAISLSILQAQSEKDNPPQD